MNIADELKKLHELHQSGGLTDSEYENAKKKVIDSSKGSSNSGFESSFNSQYSNDGVAQLNQLRRSKVDKWLGGVCGGLAKSTGLESWIWRFIFVIFTLCFLVGFVAYVLAWIFVPEEK